VLPVDLDFLCDQGDEMEVAAPGMVFICVTWYSFYKNYPYFAKIIVLLPCVGKNIGIHLNTREYPWRRPCRPAQVPRPCTKLKAGAAFYMVGNILRWCR
jgi:hypothetical protein